MARSYVIDFTHVADAIDSDDPKLCHVRRLARYFADIIEAATAVSAPVPIISAIACHCRPGRKPCPGHLAIELDPSGDLLYFDCPHCHENGRIENFAHTRFNLYQDDDWFDDDTLTLSLTPAEYQAIVHIHPLDRQALVTLRRATYQDHVIMVLATVPQIDHLAAHVVAAAPETRPPHRNHLIAALGRMVHLLAEHATTTTI